MGRVWQDMLNLLGMFSVKKHLQVIMYLWMFLIRWLALRVPQNEVYQCKGAAKSFYPKRVPWPKKGWETLV